MPVKVYKPTSAGRRNASVLDFSHLTKGKRPEKSLTERLKKTGGRNAHGHITSRFRGGGARKLYRKVDFRRDKDGVPATVKALEYDPETGEDILDLVEVGPEGVVEAWSWSEEAPEALADVLRVARRVQALLVDAQVRALDRARRACHRHEELLPFLDAIQFHGQKS